MKETLYTLVLYKKESSQDWELIINENLTKQQYLQLIADRVLYSYIKLSLNKLHNDFVQFEGQSAYSLSKHLLRYTAYIQKTNKEVNPFLLKEEISNFLEIVKEKTKNRWYHKQYPYFSGVGPVPGTGKKKNLKYYRAEDRNISTGRFLKSLYIEDEFKNLVKSKGKPLYFDPWDYDLRSTTNKKSWKLHKNRKKQWDRS